MTSLTPGVVARCVLAVSSATGTLLLLACALAGCESSRSRSPKQILDYKLEVIRENEDQLSPEHRMLIMGNVTARTYGEIDRDVARFKEEFRAERESSARAEKAGVDVGERRRTVNRYWIQTGPDRRRLAVEPFDPLEPAGSTAAGADGSP